MNNKQSLSTRHPLILGTIVLTATGFLTRIIGFFYRIYLSRLFGEEGMGIYQLLSPVLALSFSLTGAGFQTAISRFVAAQTGKAQLHNGPSVPKSYRPMMMGISITLPLSLLCTFVLRYYSEPIAGNLLQEVRTAPMLRLLALSIPFAAVHACINGYFYGVKQASVPACTQLFEQCCRVGCVYLVAAACVRRGGVPTINVAVLGLVIGEFLSMAAALLCICIRYAQEKQRFPQFTPSTLTYARLLGMILPLSANRIVLNLLQSVESVSIPASLRTYGYDTATALSVYGVLTGMAFPLIFFPNALTSSVSVMLLPTISEHHAKEDYTAIRQTTRKTITYCGSMGFLCMGFFLLTGRFLGETLFHSELAGHFITSLSFLCPFLYLDNTLSGILQGLGMVVQLFCINAASLVLRLGFILLLMPQIGISGYLYGLLAGQIVQCAAYLICLYSSRFYSRKKH